MKKIILILMTLPIITFSQECNGNCENGYGLLYVGDESQYEGYWKDWKFEGKGVLTDNGYKYDGDWKNGKRNGKGVETWPDKTVYEGEWKNNKRDGKGIETSLDKTVYKGDWKNNKRDGKGVQTWPDNTVYEGEWKNNKRDGKGVYTTSYDEYKYDGYWKNGKQEGYGTSLNKLPKKLEEGIVYPIKYEGDWKDGKKDGKGKLFYHNGEIWDGMFEYGNKIKGYSNIENYYNPSDIIHYDKSSITINFTQHENKKQYNIKLSFGDLDQDFLFDTGASNISMPYSFLKKLEKNHIKITNLHIKDAEVELAKGKTPVEYYKIDGIQIGEYIINNVIVMVGEDVSLLFGTGVLKKFQDFKFCVSNGVGGMLEIYK